MSYLTRFNKWRFSPSFRGTLCIYSDKQCWHLCSFKWLSDGDLCAGRALGVSMVEGRGREQDWAREVKLWSNSNEEFSWPHLKLGWTLWRVPSRGRGPGPYTPVDESLGGGCPLKKAWPWARHLPLAQVLPQRGWQLRVFQQHSHHVRQYTLLSGKGIWDGVHRCPPQAAFPVFYSHLRRAFTLYSFIPEAFFLFQEHISYTLIPIRPLASWYME